MTVKTGNAPLNMSPIKVMIAAVLPALRSTLVAPGFFDPLRRGSSNPINLQVITALEIEPIRYDARINPQLFGSVIPSAINESMKNLQSNNNGDSIHHDANKRQSKVQCVFVHGWGMNSAVWSSFIEQLPDYIEPVCIDLPGHGKFNQSQFENLQDLVDHLLEQSQTVLRDSAIWVGWSLGALPVLEIARQQPGRVRKMVLLASSPCFVKQDGWELAVDETVFDLFAQNLNDNIEKTLRRFLSLQVQGMAESRDVLRILRTAIIGQGLPSTEALSAGLDVLKSTDLRAQLNQLSVPQCWLLGQRDSLVPSELHQYLSVQAGVKSHIINGSAHLPFISHAEEVMQQFLEFIHA